MISNYTDQRIFFSRFWGKELYTYLVITLEDSFVIYPQTLRNLIPRFKRMCESLSLIFVEDWWTHTLSLFAVSLCAKLWDMQALTFL
jgi:hypothetical protein